MSRPDTVVHDPSVADYRATSRAAGREEEYDQVNAP